MFLTKTYYRMLYKTFAATLSLALLDPHKHLTIPANPQQQALHKRSYASIPSARSLLRNVNFALKKAISYKKVCSFFGFLSKMP